MYLLRLDDASEYMDNEKWDNIESLLDKYNIKPIVGVIPKNEDEVLINRYEENKAFWNRVREWNERGWDVALHGFNHVYSTQSGGINPVNLRSEFAGMPLKEQKIKIIKALNIFNEHGLKPLIFIAPSHTFDENTIQALKEESNIRVVSDTIANDVYKAGEFYFIPQQCGHVRWLPFKVTTFCYHPNYMTEEEFRKLEDFIKRKRSRFGSFKELSLKDRRLSIYDLFLRSIYFFLRRMRIKFKGD